MRTQREAYMTELFKRCLDAKDRYTHTEIGGDYCIEFEGDTLYILFECSDGAEDWLHNFDFIPDPYKEREKTPKTELVKGVAETVLKYLAVPSEPYKNMFKKWRVHGGFLAVWKDMQNAIEEIVAEILKKHPEIKKIVIIGYSHGASIAVLATEDMEYLHGESYEVSGYGFGTPRVLWGIVPEEVKYRLRNFTSIRNIPDIVTHVPPMIFGFRNAGTLIKVGRKGKYSPFKAHYASAYITELNATKGEVK
jgi:hypothetical protein